MMRCFLWSKICYHWQQAAAVKSLSTKVTTSVAVSSVKTQAEPVKKSTERVKTPTESSQNRYVMQVLQNMPPPVTCDHDDTDKKDNSDEDIALEGLTPAQAKVLQAQQRRVWRANKESELNDALNKAEAAIENARDKEQSSSNTTTSTTITITHQKNDNC